MQEWVSSGKLVKLPPLKSKTPTTHCGGGLDLKQSKLRFRRLPIFGIQSLDYFFCGFSRLSAYAFRFLAHGGTQNPEFTLTLSPVLYEFPVQLQSQYHKPYSRFQCCD